MATLIIGLFAFIGVLAVALVVAKKFGVKDEDNNFIPDVVEEKVKEAEKLVVEKAKKVEAEVVEAVEEVSEAIVDAATEAVDAIAEVVEEIKDAISGDEETTEEKTEEA